MCLFYELAEKATSPGLEGMVLCRNFPFVNNICQVFLSGDLELEHMQAVWSSMDKTQRSHLGELPAAIAGAGRGH